MRARFDAKKAERTARQQLGHFLLRHDRRYSGKTSWTKTLYLVVYHWFPIVSRRAADTKRTGSMSPESPWVRIWQVVLSVGLGSFFLMVFLVIPLGARDSQRLFAKLDRARAKDDGREN